MARKPGSPRAGLAGTMPKAMLAMRAASHLGCFLPRGRPKAPGAPPSSSEESYADGARTGKLVGAPRAEEGGSAALMPSSSSRALSGPAALDAAGS